MKKKIGKIALIAIFGISVVLNIVHFADNGGFRFVSMK